MKKEYFRTLEAFIAFTITFIFLIFLLSMLRGAESPQEQQIRVLKQFEQRPDFRNCVYSNNITCLTSLVNGTVPEDYDYQITINDASFTNDEDLFVDALYITGGSSDEHYVVRLYHWRRS